LKRVLARGATQVSRSRKERCGNHDSFHSYSHDSSSHKK
jgi:hypothetical protein